MVKENLQDFNHTKMEMEHGGSNRVQNGMQDGT